MPKEEGEKTRIRSRLLVGLILFANLGFLLGSFLFFIWLVVHRIIIILVRVVHFGITAASATAALVSRVVFFGDVGVGVSVEVLINRLFIFISRAAVRKDIIIARVLVVKGCSNESSGLEVLIPD